LITAFTSFKLLFLIDDVTDPHIYSSDSSSSDSSSSDSSYSNSLMGDNVASNGNVDDSDSGSYSDSNKCQRGVKGHCTQSIDIMHQVNMGNCKHQ
jgi:hypothetical protein